MHHAITQSSAPPSNTNLQPDHQPNPQTNLSLDRPASRYRRSRMLRSRNFLMKSRRPTHVAGRPRLHLLPAARRWLEQRRKLRLLRYFTTRAKLWSVGGHRSSPRRATACTQRRWGASTPALWLNAHPARTATATAPAQRHTTLRCAHINT